MQFGSYKGAEMTKLRKILHRNQYGMGYEHFDIDKAEAELKEAIRGILPEHIEFQEQRDTWNRCQGWVELRIKDLIGE